ncbi:hypothetical protein DERF_009451 [Dermatophagoides farinae]|uniref:Uncharacterized protein n=1 Tax=Dermatophagoides farinae TaxID=6954 RepID=A0A922HWG3_DERFA|nr:hypothetical protein DERF_009451 [Dermatophagoides farinae]
MAHIVANNNKVKRQKQQQQPHLIIYNKNKSHKYRSLIFISCWHFIFIIIIIIMLTFFRFIDANNLSPEMLIKNVIKEQLSRQQQLQPHQPQLHHHRHHMRQSISNGQETTTTTTKGILPLASLTLLPSLSITTTTTSTPPTMTSGFSSTTIPVTAKLRKKKQTTIMQSNNNGHKQENNHQSLEGLIMRAKSPISQRMNNIFDVDSFLPQGYDKLMPPKQNGKPTKVRFHVWVLGLDSIDEGSMTYVADIFMSQSWKDNRLVIPDDIEFNVNASNDPRGPYRLLPLTFIDKIWRPDSFFKNAKEVTFQEMTIPNHYIWLYSDNTILYMVKLTLLLSCAMKFQTYPHDTQNCTMKIESLSYTTNDLVFDWEESDPLVVEEHIELPQHDLISKDIDYCTTDYSSGTFACVQVIFTIKRRLGYYIFHTYIPTCLIVIMSWISFWIKPEAVPARVTLCVTSLLTLSTQHAQSQKSLPPVSYIKAIDIFMSSCTVFVFASLMEYALVNILMADELLNGGFGLNWSCEPNTANPNLTTTTRNRSRSNERQQTESKIIQRSRSGTTKEMLNQRYQQQQQQQLNAHFYHHHNAHHHSHHNHPPSCSVRSLSLTRLDLASQVNDFNDDNDDDGDDDVTAAAAADADANARFEYSDDIKTNGSTVSNLRHRIGSIFNYDNNITTKPKIQRSIQKPFCLYGSGFRVGSTSDDSSPKQEKIFHSRKTTFGSRNDLQFNLDQSINQFLLQSKHRRAYTVDHISRWIFPLSFTILNIVYWAYYLNVCNECSVW